MAEDEEPDDPAETSVTRPSAPRDGKSRSHLVSVAATRQESYSGPLPHPDILRRYGDIIPTAPERILRMAEKQEDHRHEMEKFVITRESRRSDMGVGAATIIALASIAAGAFIVVYGHTWAGIALPTIDIVGTATVFIYGTASRRQERMEKTKVLAKDDED